MVGLASPQWLGPQYVIYTVLVATGFADDEAHSIPFVVDLTTRTARRLPASTEYIHDIAVP